MPIRIISLSMILVLLCSTDLSAQVMPIFQSLLSPRSLPAAGMGEQGVASNDPLDALQFNPANLAYAEGASVSFFNNPWKILHTSDPLTTWSGFWKISDTSAIGLEYTYWDLGEGTFPDLNGVISSHDFFERSLSAALGTELGNHVAAGIEARYAWMPEYFPSQTIQHLLVSAGISASPGYFRERVRLGLSLMNFSTPVEVGSGNPVFVESDPPPAELNLGLEGDVLQESTFDLKLSLGMMKAVTKRAGAGYTAESSFSALFNSWVYFPNDATGEAGLGFLWRPIDLGGGVSFLQEMYLGYFSSGPYGFGGAFLTHGATVGLDLRGVRLTAGYAGRWHNYRTSEYVPWDFPWEEFQFNVSGNLGSIGRGKAQPSTTPPPHHTILSAGFVYGDPIGKLHENKAEGIRLDWSQKGSWSVASDFYIDERSALHTAFSYARMIQSASGTIVFGGYPLTPIPYQVEVPTETVSLESGYRYHPLEEYHPLFVQASLGIVRMNPIPETSPRYLYESYDELVIGLALPVSNGGIVVMPRVGFKTFYFPEDFNNNRVGGYNEFTAGVSVGYAL
ncbi:MAG TPA: hypothetical protein VMG34_13575 [Bacteroidota bacterium]|nr:hypothetical protein [Bacteroidota bacterium]